MTIATDLVTAKTQLVTDAAILRAIVTGPASGGSSLVDVGGGVMVKTLARVAAEGAGGHVPMDGSGDATVTRDLSVGRNATVVGTLGVTGIGSVGGLNFPNAGVAAATMGIWSGSGTILSFKGGSGGYTFLNNAAGANIFTISDVGALAAAGNVGGGGTPEAKLHAIAGAILVDNNNALNWKDTGGTQRNVLILNSGGGLQLINNNVGTGGPIQFMIGATEQARFSGSAYQPGGDNNQTLGSASFRWSTVYAGTGTIDTSAREAKRNIVFLRGWPPDDPEPLKAAAAKRLRVGARLLKRFSVYQFADAVEKKGEENARYHTGLVFDDVVGAYEAEGLDALREGAVCRDLRIDEETYGEEELRPVEEEIEQEQTNVEIEDGRPVLRTRIVKVPRPVVDMVQVRNEAGEALTQVVGHEPTGVIGSDGSPVLREVTAPWLHPVPRMRAVSVPKTRHVETDEWVEGLRYSELWPLMLAAMAAGVTVDD